MAGPKHLWSGDWEHESEQASDERRFRLPPQPQDAAAEPEPAARSQRRFSLRQIVAGLAVLVVAGVAIALVISPGTTVKRARPRAAKPATATTQAPSTGPTGGIALTQPSAPSSIVNTPSANWLGMHIVTSPLGAVVSTVSGGSEGEAAGVQPGDVITAVGTDAISSAKQIRAAVANIAIGDRVQITINRGSTILTVAATLRNRPTIQP